MLSLTPRPMTGVSKAIGLHLVVLSVAVGAGAVLSMFASQGSIATLLVAATLGLAPLFAGSYWGLRRFLRPTEVVERLLGGITEGAMNPHEMPQIGVASPAARGWNVLTRQARKWFALSELEASVQRGLAETGSDGGLEVLDCLSDGVATTDETGRILHCNQAFAAICGLLDAEGAKQAQLSDIAPFPEDARLTLSTSPCGMRVSLEFGTNVGEQRRTLRVTRTPMSDAVQSLTGHAWTLRDVTQQRLAENMRDKFLTTATHELRTPLANIRAYAESLATVDDIDAESQKRFYNIIQSEAVRLSQLIDDLLDVSRMQAGALSIDRREMDLGRMVEEVTEKVDASMKARDIEFLCELPPKYPKISADKSKLSAAIVNLLGNAAKYTPEGGRVTFRVEASERRLEFSIADTGIGIGPEEIAHVFDRFFRSEDDRVREIPGSGLGLSLTQEIARLHGGDLTVDSELNVGSIFRLNIPLQEAI